MTKLGAYAEKALSGKTPSPAEWEELLRESHRVAPGMTPAAFAGRKTKDGLNSYELLAQAVDGLTKDGIHLLDLACGDGHLLLYLLGRHEKIAGVAGLDMSEGELELARKQFGHHSQVRFVNGRAQEMPFAAGEFDAVLCHMAFMLMNPVEPVLKEIHRVLSPGGIFSYVTAIKGGRNMELVGKAITSFFQRRFPLLTSIQLPTGDKRTRILSEINSLFGSMGGFKPNVSIEELELEGRMNFDALWGYYRDTYLIGMLPEEAKTELKADFEKLFEENKEGDGKLPHSIAMLKVTAQRL